MTMATCSSSVKTQNGSTLFEAMNLKKKNMIILESFQSNVTVQFV